FSQMLRTYLVYPGRREARRSKIFRLEDRPVVDLVAGGDVGHGPHGELAAARGASPFPGRGVEVAEEEKGGLPHVLEFTRQIAQLALREIRIGHVVVLLETGERRLVVAREAEGAVGEDALGVDDVAHDLLDAPFARRIAEIGPLGGDAAEQRQ